VWGESIDAPGAAQTSTVSTCGGVAAAQYVLMERRENEGPKGISFIRNLCATVVSGCCLTQCGYAAVPARRYSEGLRHRCLEFTNGLNLPDRAKVLMEAPRSARCRR